jgi:hypothetical protein
MKEPEVRVGAGNVVCPTQGTQRKGRAAILCTGWQNFHIIVGVYKSFIYILKKKVNK